MSEFQRHYEAVATELVVSGIGLLIVLAFVAWALCRMAARGDAQPTATGGVEPWRPSSFVGWDCEDDR